GWGGWGGAQVVKKGVGNKNVTVNVTNVTVYRNVHVTNAVVGVPADRFGHAGAPMTRVAGAEVQGLQPVHGPIEVKPVAASVMPSTGPAIKPPPASWQRPVGATRPRHDVQPALRARAREHRP